MMLWLVCLGSLFSVKASAQEAQTQTFSSVTLTLPKHSYRDDKPNSYLFRLLQEALLSQGLKAQITYTAESMNQKRAVEALSNHEHINLCWFATTPELEARLQPIKVPLYYGLHGERVLLINKNKQAAFKSIQSLDDLSTMVGLQKYSWSEYALLRFNGLNINGQQSYEGMFKALEEGIADYFPRSVLTVQGELARQNRQETKSNLMIEPRLLLRFPNNYYFFTHKNDNALAVPLQQGLETLQANGRFKALFEEHYGNSTAGLNLSQRQVLHLKVPPG
ncbi:transporter substrate-binding domain-containing protein [Aliiglaciecola sp. CAU 1673]|uniref:substrate-binding periplasmic protein n=1 Tax=Aliiglaciecola sp. CAU 1673 TaxID=3032595 RepID=UPI0023DB4F6D|nr:transporter substrate-binding domain-containing protein [Aliiglaciecola sp. CAU 1673]MDF2176644.1 transporter substrate-binding domain-containing protein [Aliiglaciecola sp. CAU 1673]